MYKIVAGIMFRHVHFLKNQIWRGAFKHGEVLSFTANNFFFESEVIARKKIWKCNKGELIETMYSLRP
jgi:hypothetical protein